MSYGFIDVAVTPSVRAVQAKMGADRIWQDFKGHREFGRQQHITPRFTEQEIAQAVHPLREHLARLEAENAALRAQLNTQGEK